MFYLSKSTVTLLFTQVQVKLLVKVAHLKCRPTDLGSYFFNLQKSHLY